MFYQEHKANITLLWYPRLEFHVLHITAMTSIVIGILSSIGILIYNALHQGFGRFWKWLPGARLVVYLAICDLGFAATHGSDHVVIYITKWFPEDTLCNFFGFGLQWFMGAQSLVVLTAAVQGFLLVVKGRRIGYGKYDCKLLLLCFGFPALLGFVFAGLGYLGPTGAWCFADMRIPEGPIIHTFYSVIIMAVFLCISALYLGMWISIKRSSDNVMQMNKNRTASDRIRQRSIHMAKTFSLLSAAYIAQWFSWVIYSFWSIFDDPPYFIYLAMVMFCNLGGVFNAIAYTLMKRSYREQLHSGTPRSSIPNNGSVYSFTIHNPGALNDTPVSHLPSET